MQTTRKLLSVLLAMFLLAAVFSVPVVAFSDLTGHWAASYMEDLAEKNYLTGYSDGTMRPENQITGAEALTILSRFYTPDEAAVQRMEEDFGDTVLDALPANLSWASREVVICLAAGILREDELAVLDLSVPIEKELLSVFLVRAMQQERVATAYGTGVSLGFLDEQDITSAYRGYIYTLFRAGIVEGDNNYFYPHASVTRAVCATMVSRSLDYMERNGIVPEISGYRNTTTQQGVIVAAGGETISIRGLDSLIRYYEIPASAKTTVNGATRLLSSLYVGDYATVTLDTAGNVTAISVDSRSSVTWVQGSITRTSTSGSLRQIYLLNADAGTYATYTVSSGTALQQGGQAVGFSDLKTGNFATLKLTGSSLSAVYSQPADQKLIGTISALEFGSTITLLIDDGSETLYCFYLDIANLPTILKGTAAISIDNLKAGDRITVNITSGAISSITADTGAATTVTGTLNSIVSSVDKISWVVLTDTGSITCDVSPNATVRRGDTTVSLSEVRAGDRVTLTLYDDEATDITLLESASLATKIIGQVLSADVRNRQIILLSGNRLIYVSVSDAAPILNARTGSILTLSTLNINSQAVVYGTYTASNHFNATAVILES